MPAWRRRRGKRSWLISVSCGFGIVSVTDPLIIYGCFPSWYGPTKPNFLKRTIKSRREIGPSLGIYLRCFYFSWYLKTRYYEAITEAEDKPSFKRRQQIGATGFESCAGRPHSAKLFNLSVETLPAINHFVASLREKLVYKILNHTRSIPQRPPQNLPPRNRFFRLSHSRRGRRVPVSQRLIRLRRKIIKSGCIVVSYAP